MYREKTYPRVMFDAAAFRRIWDEIRAFEDGILETPNSYISLTIRNSRETWTYSDFEEFVAHVNDSDNQAILFTLDGKDIRVEGKCYRGTSDCSVQIGSSSRARIIKLGNVVDSCAGDCYVPEPEVEKQPVGKEEFEPKPVIFIGHGGSPQWRDLKDHLHEHHNYEIEAYETGERAGHTIRDVVEDMLGQSSIAILVMTGEDEQPDGTIRARQNVVHELGLFQGRLGFTKAVVLLEEGTEEFSNIHGVQQIRYAKGRIKETFGAVLAFLKRSGY
jgi:hypothetical protein